MAAAIVTEKVCTVCQISKALDNFDYWGPSKTVRHRRCKHCRAHPRNPNKYHETSCKQCGQKASRRTDAIKIWNGRCRKCASKINNNRVEMAAQRVARRLKTIGEWSQEKRDAFSEHARQQVLRQGGIPNAKPFVKEGQDGRRMAGETHYAWKGEEAAYHDRLIDMGRSQYKQWRKAVFERDNYTCQFCGLRGCRLHADHILPYSTHIELRYEVSNGRTLCVSCHKTTPTWGFRSDLHVVRK